MTSRTWYLVRHGETEWNATGRMQGRLDSPLTALGREQAGDAARLLARLGVDAIFASPLGRVRETLAVMADDLPLPVMFDDRLVEWSSGDWSGERHGDIPHKWPAQWAAWEADRYFVRSPGGENFVDLADRARAFFADAAATPGPRIAVVAHGFLNRALAGVLLGLSPVETMRILQSNETIIRIAGGESGWTIDHFVGGDGPAPGLPKDVQTASRSA
jgi:broad specificity phosphatase PhoE